MQVYRSDRGGVGRGLRKNMGMANHRASKGLRKKMGMTDHCERERQSLRFFVGLVFILVFCFLFFFYFVVT